MMSPWGDTVAGRRPTWPSPIGDDHTPFEFSLTLGARPELRFLVEPLGAMPSLQSNRETAFALLESLSHDFDLDFQRLDRVRDLFLPEASARLVSR
jgi:hypothetical protein